jgi:hypothetical protein
MKKNLYLLPTDKPSRLIIYSILLNEFRLLADPIEDWKHKRNVYVTSDEEPKYKDFYITDGTQIYYCNTLNPTRNNHYKKIILTTDPDLIKNGVQAIPDEFLEWFVKNPSCEEVEVIKIEDEIISPKNPKIRFNALQDPPSFISAESLNNMILTYKYKIIITKEEPNREITFEKVFGEEKKKGLKEFIDKHKKETLEEAVERLFNYHSNNTSLAEGHYDYMMDKEDFKQASYELVKWQQEQYKNKFSAEEVRRIAEWSFHFYKTNEFDDDELEAEWSRILDNDLKKK